MCLFVIDGTWSRDFNSLKFGKDRRNLPVGNLDLNVRSNSRRFFDESKYPKNKKFYYGGPKYGVTGADAMGIYKAVISDIEREIVNGNCSEISLVGWSRGAAIAAEVAQGLLEKEYARIYKKVSSLTSRGTREKLVIDGEVDMLPEIKFLGLFDPVAMILPLFHRPGKDREWGEHIPSKVNYFIQIVAADRSGPIPSLMDFTPRAPQVSAKKNHKITVAFANHGDVGGNSSKPYAHRAYQIMRFHASQAGVK